MSNKPKILLAVGERALENVLKKDLSGEYSFTKEASYREIVISRVRDEQPDIVLIREALKGSMPIDNLIFDIRESYPEVRIVFYTKKYRPGEPLLRKLVSYGVYDFIAGESVTKGQIFEGIRNRKQLADVRQYLDAPSIDSSEAVAFKPAEYAETTEPEEEISFPELKAVPVKQKAEKLPKEPKESKNSNKLFGKLLPFGKKKEKPKKEVVNKKEKQRAILVEEAPDEEREFHTGETNDIDVVLSIDESNVPNTKKPMPLFHQDIVEPEPKQVPVIIASTQEVKEPEPMDDVEMTDDVEADEEDLFSSLEKPEYRTTVKTPLVPEQIPVQLDEEPVNEVEKETLKLSARGKPNEEVPIHRKEPEIDFNPLEVEAFEDKSDNQEQVNPIQNQLPVRPAKNNEPKEFLEEHYNDEETIRCKRDLIRVASKRIVTFVGATNGVGNTHAAYNSAVKLAEEGNKVLFMECHSAFSSVDFSLQMGTWQQGIEKALEDVEYNQGNNVTEHILRIRKKKQEAKKDKALRKLYKPLPDTLDYMFYSQDYQTLEEQHYVPKERLKDLVMYLLMKEDYDVIIVDSEPIGSSGVDGLLSISTKVYITMTQDPAQMGVFHRQFDATQKRINVTKDRYIIVNQFVKTEPTVQRIQEWTNESVLQTIPLTHKDVVTANYLGVPFIQKTKHQSAIQAFEALIEHVAE